MSKLSFNSFEEMYNDEEIKAMVYKAVSKYRPYLDKDTIDSEADMTLLSVWRLHDESKGKVSTYLYTALFNNLNRLLRKKYNSPVDVRINEDIFPDISITQENAFELLDSLNPKEKDIVSSHILYGETFVSIGKKMKMKPSKVSRILKKSIKKVKKDCIG